MDCSTAAAIHNLTVYGTEILYTATANTVSNISFEFQLYNALIDVDAQCSAHLSNLPTEPKTWPCFVESRDTSIAASFAFDLATHELTVYESWLCQSGATTLTTTAQGTNSIALLCAETVSEGQHYCTSVPAVALPVGVRVGEGR